MTTRNILDIYDGIMCIIHKFLESISSVINIQHSMWDFHKGKTALLNNTCDGILPTNMPESLLIHNILVSGVYMDDITNTKYLLHHLHLVGNLFQQRHDKISDIYVSITASLLQLIYILCVREES